MLGLQGPCVETGWNMTTPAVNCCGKGGRNTTTCTDEWAAKCSNMCYANVRTSQYMGGIHPRSKGLRLLGLISNALPWFEAVLRVHASTVDGAGVSPPELRTWRFGC